MQRNHVCYEVQPVNRVNGAAGAQGMPYRCKLASSRCGDAAVVQLKEPWCRRPVNHGLCAWLGVLWSRPGLLWTQACHKVEELSVHGRCVWVTCQTVHTA